MNRVVITGLGAVTPIGNSFSESWEAVKRGRSGIRTISKFDAEDIPWKMAGELERFDTLHYLNTKEIKRLDSFIHYSFAASVMALEDAGLLQRNECVDNAAVGLRASDHRWVGNGYLAAGGVLIGSSRGGISAIEKAFHASCETGSRSRTKPAFSAYLMPATTISMASSYVAQKIGVRGYCLGISNACASGTTAIGEAYRLIRGGYGGPLIAGGAEAPVCRLCIEGYGISGALSRRQTSDSSRPFDRGRDGFVLAEGAGVLVLESLAAAVRRGARIYGEIVGYSNTVDAFHQTRPDVEGEMRALQTAMEEAGLSPDDVDYINTHGSSTQLGDLVEAQAIKGVFGKRACSVPASALKAATGHMLGASGAVETAFTVMSMYEGVVPPSINLAEKDERCDINVITKMTERELRSAIKTSFGFGGVNAVLVLKSYK